MEALRGRWNEVNLQENLGPERVNMLQRQYYWSWDHNRGRLTPSVMILPKKQKGEQPRMVVESLTQEADREPFTGKSQLGHLEAKGYWPSDRVFLCLSS